MNPNTITITVDGMPKLGKSHLIKQIKTKLLPEFEEWSKGKIKVQFIETIKGRINVIE